jgi:hypothetical protein
MVCSACDLLSIFFCLKKTMIMCCYYQWWVPFRGGTWVKVKNFSHFAYQIWNLTCTHLFFFLGGGVFQKGRASGPPGPSYKSATIDSQDALRWLPRISDLDLRWLRRVSIYSTRQMDSDALRWLPYQTRI